MPESSVMPSLGKSRLALKWTFEMKRSITITLLAISGLGALLITLTVASTERREVNRSQRADTLTLGVESDNGSLDPARTSTLDWTPATQICETLILSEPGHNLKPGLAVSWDRPNAHTWRFRLRQGVRFHDGSVLDANAAKRSLLRAFGLSAGGQGFRIESISAPDTSTLLITTEKPFSPLPEYLSYINFAVLSPANLARGAEDVALHPVGTGPFKLEQYVPGRSALLARNESYWGRVPRLSHLAYRVIPDPLSRLLSLEAGEIDAMRAIPLPELPRLRRSKTLRLVIGPGRHTHHLTFNRATSPLRRYFDEVHVRQAFNYAVDRDALVKVVLNGAGEPATGAMPPWASARGAIPGYVHDVARAKALLAAAGWPKGTRVRYIFSPGWLPQNEPMAELLQAQFHEVGIDLVLEPMEFGGAAQAEKNGDADIRHRGVTLTMGGTYYALWSRYDSANSRAMSVDFSNRRVDELFERAETAMDSGTEDEFLREIQGVVSDDAADVPLYYEDEVVAVNLSVRGDFSAGRGSKPDLEEVYIERVP
jgi:peptide/nickel transport system substrate-binding protein